jgi:hypothetical protein
MNERREMSHETPGFWGNAVRALRDAVIAALLSALLAVVVNLTRSNGISFIADEPYDILVPCPEPGGEVTAVLANDPALRSDTTFYVDARTSAEFEKWRYRDARNVVFDYLDPTPKEQIQALAKAIARSRATKVVVYGDGQLPDTGEQLGKEISGHGIKNVFFVEGGAEALKTADTSGRKK